jgi:hypothetical protein
MVSSPYPTNSFLNSLTILYAVPLAGSDLRGHAFGTKAFIRGPLPTTTSLRRAVYWSGLRQEIYNALCLQKAPDIDISSLHSHFNPPEPEDGDCAWANRAIAHCADVLLFCFGEKRRSVAVHGELRAKNEAWHEEKPDSFEPYYVGGDVDTESGFPDLRFSSACHGVCYWMHMVA